MKKVFQIAALLVGALFIQSVQAQTKLNPPALTPHFQFVLGHSAYTSYVWQYNSIYFADSNTTNAMAVILKASKVTANVPGFQSPIYWATYVDGKQAYEENLCWDAGAAVLDANGKEVPVTVGFCYNAGLIADIFSRAPESVNQTDAVFGSYARKQANAFVFGAYQNALKKK